MSSLDVLRRSGIAVDEFSPAQQQVLSDLTADESALLSTLHQRLDPASGDVEAHTNVIGGVLF